VRRERLPHIRQVVPEPAVACLVYPKKVARATEAVTPRAIGTGARKVMPNAPSPPAAGSAAPKTSRRNFLVATASSAALPAVSRVASAKTVRAQDPRHASAPVGLALRVNGNEHLVPLDIRTTLLDALREHLA
jgi:hypothetical protein